MRKSRFIIAMIVGSFGIAVGLFNMLRPGGNVLSGILTGLGGLVIVVGIYIVNRKARMGGYNRDPRK